jgi:hypothetical protein
VLMHLWSFQKVLRLEKSLCSMKAETRTRDEDWLSALVSHPTC